ncbi:hypothetical protein WT56_04095 [Burkholderia pseudomultivorans]|uniref:Uncharacterized protein n=1 Tax=Burkholderia pseudomultivorans TaxID=1207504 RepID=A0A132ENG3_9BURK|nr:hypothetical protein WT56_04095 [Burkholderia pseudomultivorans]
MDASTSSQAMCHIAQGESGQALPRSGARDAGRNRRKCFRNVSIFDARRQQRGVDWIGRARRDSRRTKPGGIQSAQARLDDASRALTFSIENVAAT